MFDKSSQLTLLLSLFAISVFAQNTGNLKRKIQTQKGEDVAGLTVSLLNTTYGMVADEQGNFLLKNIPADSYRLRA